MKIFQFQRVCQVSKSLCCFDAVEIQEQNENGTN